MFSIWFLFHDDDHNYLHNTITRLSKKYQSPIFLPHVTAYNFIDAEFDLINQSILDSLKNIKPFFVEKIEINQSNSFWKTVFIDLKHNDDFVTINKNFNRHFLKYSNYMFSPHISLIYKNMGEIKRKNIVDELFIKTKFRIQKVGLLEFSEHIDKWKIIQNYEFGLESTF